MASLLILYAHNHPCTPPLCEPMYHDIEEQAGRQGGPTHTTRGRNLRAALILNGLDPTILSPNLSLSVLQSRGLSPK